MNPSRPNPASLRGKLTLRLRVEQGRVAEVAIVSTRPQAAALLTGKTPEQAVHLAPLIFSLCGGAQGVAAEAALMAACGAGADAARLAIWANAVRREAATEHLWRLMLDWPRLLGMARQEAEYASCRTHCLQATTDAELAKALTPAVEGLLGMPAQDWLEQDPPAFTAWRETSGAPGAEIMRRLPRTVARGESSIPFLSSTTAQEWANLGDEIAALEFCRFPSWHDRPHESGALARQQKHALVAPLVDGGRRVEARMVARLVELAQWAGGDIGTAQDWIDAAPCGTNQGVARVETARGLLIHRVQVKNGLVAAYAVVAPTEWNFHPQGAFAREAQCIMGADETAVLRQAHMLALALDPCVEYEVVVRPVRASIQ